MASDQDNVSMVDLHMESKVDAFCDKYQINASFRSRLDRLKDYKIVVIADDSGSMASKTNSRIEGVKTRWDELKLMCRLLVELYSTFNDDGIDIHFLNRNGIRAVTHADDDRLIKSFQHPPAGPTPICNALKSVLLDDSSDRAKIIIIATDGCPTNMAGNPDVAGLKQMLHSRNASTNYVAIVACTDDDDTLDYLNRWDVEIANLDVVDDYVSERTEIWRAQGRDFRFGYADYVIKLALGCVDKYFDRLDEITPQRLADIQSASRHAGCCVIL